MFAKVSRLFPSDECSKLKNCLHAALICLIPVMVFLLGDIYDEFVLQTDCWVSLIAGLILAIFWGIIYSVICIRTKPSFKPILYWLLSVFVIGLVLLVLGYVLVDLDWIISYKHYCSFLCLNGIEYYIYPILVYGGFLVLALLFHLGYFVVRKIVKAIR